MTRAAGLAPLNLDLGGLDLRRRIGLITRPGGYLSPVCNRLIELFKDEACERNIQEWL